MSHKIYSKLTIITAVTILWGANSQPATAAFFTGLGDLPGSDFNSSATGVSADGSVVVGIGFSEQIPMGEAFRWTAKTGLVGLGDLPGGERLSGAFGVSSNGRVVAGASTSEASNNSVPPLESFRWTAKTGLVALGDLPGGTFSSFTNGISGDGTTVIGSSDSASGREAFRWTAATGIVGLGDLPGGSFNSTATGASFDGSVIVGSGTNDLGIEAFRWTEGTGLVGIGDLPGGELFSRAASVSSDGSVIVGRSSSNDSSGLPISNFSGTEAFRWTAATGIVGLGDLPGGNFFSRAVAASGDGSIIVGQSEGAFGEESFIWDSVQGIRSLIDVLTNDFGLDLSDWSNLTVTDISDDGLTLVGFGINGDGNFEAWVANVEPQQVSTPEPSSVWGTLAVCGVFGAISWSKRKRNI